jgi:hypothetical protein
LLGPVEAQGEDAGVQLPADGLVWGHGVLGRHIEGVRDAQWRAVLEDADAWPMRATHGASLPMRLQHD